MKKIAITQRLIKNEAYNEIRDALDVKWSIFLRTLGYLPIILPTYIDYVEYFKEVDIAGIVLSGGNDLGSLSGQMIDRKRDDFEKGIISFAIENKIPILGVCRGMQIIGDYFGMKLEKVENHVAVKHRLVLNSSSLHKVDPADHIKVNSYHNYGFTSAIQGFDIIANSEDGVIEAMMHKQHKILTIMWHPEREENVKNADLDLITCFFNGGSK